MRVVIMAELPPGGGLGGVEQAILGLAHGLSHLADGDDEYLFTVHRWARGWLDPYLGPNGRVVVRDGTYRAVCSLVTWRLQRDTPAVAKRVLRAAYAGLQVPLRRAGGRDQFTLERSDGFYESLAPHVVHFPYQSMSLTALPTIFAPWDLQHLHYPQFFTREQVRWRDFHYREWCRRATALEVGSHWARDDVIARYVLPGAKVHAIARGAPVQAYALDEAALRGAARTLHLPERFCLYPAQTWRHKNHLRLLDALALLRDRDGERLHLVCTGRKNDFWPHVERRIRELDLQSLVTFLGYVPPIRLRALYRLAEFVVYPSLFEGGGLPVVEAFVEGAPLACANATCLPEQAGDAALLFDPLSVDSIAAALRALHRDRALRLQLRERGANRVRHLTWERTARHFRALYRSVGGQPLSQEDRELLAAGQFSQQVALGTGGMSAAAGTRPPSGGAAQA
jgi:glycosyltransferase involved in cell wall biosynthesis